MRRKNIVTIAFMAVVSLALLCLILFKGKEQTEVGIDGDNSQQSESRPLGSETLSSLNEKESIKDKLRKYKNVVKEINDQKNRMDNEKEEKTSVAQIGKFYWENAYEVFEEIFSEELPNKEWSESVTTYLDQHLNEIDYPGTKVTQVDCRTDLCRVSLSHDSEESAKIFEKIGHELSPWSGGLYVRKHKLEDGEHSERFMYFSDESMQADRDPFAESRTRILARYNDGNR